MSLEGTVELALRNNEGPLYIVHFSQDAALASAQALSSFGVTSKEQREQIKATLGAGKFTTQFGKTLKRLLLSGIACIMPACCLVIACWWKNLPSKGCCR